MLQINLPMKNLGLELDRQKSYAYNCRRALEFDVGNKIFLKLST